MASRNKPNLFGSNHHRDADAHAPEAVDMSSPLTPVTNLETELQTKYQSAQRQPPRPRPADAEKEVVHLEHDSALKHVVPLELTSEPPETATAMSPPTPWTMEADTLKPRSMSDAAPEALPSRGRYGDAKKHQKVLGMRKKTFLILIVAGIILIAAAIAGGVGGAMASRNKSHATPATNSPASSSSSTPSSSTTTTTTSSAASSPTVEFLNNQTWPEGYTFAFQGYSRPNFTGAATPILTGDGETNKDFEFDVHSYIWVPNIGNCCINFCVNSTKQGYLGYRCSPVRKNESSQAVARAFVWCADTHTNAMAESKGCS